MSEFDRCPVCDTRGDFEMWDLCPVCEFQFGYNDATPEALAVFKRNYEQSLVEENQDTEIKRLRDQIQEAREIIEAYNKIAEGSWGNQEIPERARAWLEANNE